MNFNKAEFERAYGLAEQLPPSEKIEIVFAGRSNVGKSSLINKLFNRKNLARVSSVPGKTATVNFYSCENVHLVDLPGYGFAKAAKGEKIRFSQLVGGYLGDTERNIGLVIQLVEIGFTDARTCAVYLRFNLTQKLYVDTGKALCKTDKIRVYAKSLQMGLKSISCEASHKSESS